VATTAVSVTTTALEQLAQSTFFEGVVHFRRIFDKKGGIAHQSMLVWEN